MAGISLSVILIDDTYSKEMFQDLLNLNGSLIKLSESTFELSVEETNGSINSYCFEYNLFPGINEEYPDNIWEGIVRRIDSKPEILIEFTSLHRDSIVIEFFLSLLKEIGEKSKFWIVNDNNISGLKNHFSNQDLREISEYEIVLLSQNVTDFMFENKFFSTLGYN